MRTEYRSQGEKKSQAEIVKAALAAKQNVQPQKVAFELDELTEQGLGSRSFLYEEINAGRLRAVKRGRRTIVLAPDRQAYLDSLPRFEPKDAA